MSSTQIDPLLRFIRQLAVGRIDNELPDHRLLERFATARDEAAFAALLRRHGPMVLRVCQSVLHNLHDSEDVFQAAFLVLARKAGSIQRREAVSGWLYRVAYHLAVKAQANAVRRKNHEKRAAVVPSAEPLLDMSLRELQGVLHEEIQRLPEQYRAPLLLCGLEDRSLEEAAHLLGWSKGCVKGRLHRGREQLRARLRRRGLDLSAGLLAAALATNSISAQLPATLTASTLRAALQIGAGRGLAAGAVSANVAALVQGAMPTMFFSKLKIVTLVVLATSICAAGLGAIARRELTDQPADPPSKQAIKTPDSPQIETAGPVQKTAKDSITVGGRVFDLDGKPFAGAKVYLAKPASMRGDAMLALSQQTVSGPDGRFQFPVASSVLDQSPWDEPARIMAVADGFGCDWATIDTEQKAWTLRLVKDVPIRMRILDTDGKPVAGAKVAVMGVSSPEDNDLGHYLDVVREGISVYHGLAKQWRGPLPGQSGVLTTGRDGRFRLTGAGAERIIHLRVEGPGIASASLHVMSRMADSVAIPKRGWGKAALVIHSASSDYVALARPSRPIRGVVRDKQTGKPLAGVSVGSAVSDKEGRYELLSMGKGSGYSLSAQPADGLHFRRNLWLQDTPGLGALTCDIELVRGLTVRGRVTDKDTGKPIMGARVEYYPLLGNTYVNKEIPGAWGPRSQTTSGSVGGYALTVMPGPGVITVTSPRWHKYLPAVVTLKERKDFFKHPLVLDRDEAWMRCSDGSVGGFDIHLKHYNAVVLLEPDEKDRELVKNLSLQQRQLPERKVRIVGPDGHSLTGVRVWGLGPNRDRVETLNGSELTVPEFFPRERHPLAFFHKVKNLGYFLEDLRDQKEELLIIKLQPCGSACGRVVDKDGEPVAGTGLWIDMGTRGRDKEGSFGYLFGSFGSYQTVITDKEGRFRVALVPGVRYFVQIHSERPSVLSIFAPVIVKPGEEKDMGDLKMGE